MGLTEGQGLSQQGAFRGEDGQQALGVFGGSEVARYRGAIAIFGACGVFAYAVFLRAHLRRAAAAPG